MTERIDIHPIVFPPEVLARISPDISLQRHLSLETRPCSRGFEEFRDVAINDGNISRYSTNCQNATTNNIIGSSLLRSGKTFVITSITGGIIEETLPANNTEDVGEEELMKLSDDTDRLSENATIYPVVEVQRGRVGGPTDEEMITSEKLYKTLLHSGILKKTALAVSCGIRRTEEDGSVTTIYSDELLDEEKKINEANNRKWSYVLYAKIQVFSRNGPIFDLCWNSLISALKTVQLPRAFLDERAADLKIAIRTRGRSMTIRETYDILCDPHKSLPLKLNEGELCYGSNYGIIDIEPLAQLAKIDEEMDVDKPTSVLLADIETEAEESSILSTLSLTTNKNGQFKAATIIGGDSKITPEMIKRCIFLSKQRSKDIESKV
ncbi:Rrp43 [Kluyveromyces lactis]|nr:Rrp43 [Kluyveromyces lactis]